MQKNGFFWAAIVVINICAFAIAGEAVTLGLGVKPFQPRFGVNLWADLDDGLGWVNKPNSRFYQAHVGEYMTFLEDGRRAAYAGESRQASKKPEILLIGGSTVQGAGVKDSDTFGWFLAQRLPGFNIRNFGVGGYGTYQSMLMMEKLLAESDTSPALVVYGLIPDHLNRNVVTYGWVSNFSNARGQRYMPPNVSLKDGHFRESPLTIIDNWPFEEYSSLITFLHDQMLKFKLSDRRRYVAPVTNAVLGHMKRLADHFGTKILIVTMAKFRGREEVRNWRKIDIFMRETGIRHIDCANPDFGIDPSLQPPNDGHPNGIVHAEFGQCVASWVRKNAHLVMGNKRESNPK